jgi:hypothetical protein
MKQPLYARRILLCPTKHRSLRLQWVLLMAYAYLSGRAYPNVDDGRLICCAAHLQLKELPLLAVDFEHATPYAPIRTKRYCALAVAEWYAWYALCVLHRYPALIRYALCAFCTCTRVYTVLSCGDAAQGTEKSQCLRCTRYVVLGSGQRVVVFESRLFDGHKSDWVRSRFPPRHPPYYVVLFIR